jgi:RNA-dependent RNA polymerase
MAFLPAALQIKILYDEALRRLMFQYGIKSEFEVWTTFVLEHSNEYGSDWKFAESLGEAFMALNHHFQDVCFDAAGTSRDARDWTVLKPWVVAMYKVTAEESRRCEPSDEMRLAPLISFPWLFPRELGIIANAEPLVEDTESEGDLLGELGIAEPRIAGASPSPHLLGELEVEESLSPLPIAGDPTLTSARLRHDLVPPTEVASPLPPDGASYEQFQAEQDLMYFSDEESMADDGEHQRESHALMLTPATSTSVSHQPDSTRTSLDLTGEESPANEEDLTNEEILMSLFMSDETQRVLSLAQAGDLSACVAEAIQSDDETPATSTSQQPASTRTSLDLTDDQDFTNEEILASLFINDDNQELPPSAQKDELFVCEVEVPHSDYELKSSSNDDTPASSSSLDGDDIANHSREETVNTVDAPAIKEEADGGHDGRVVQEISGQEPKSRGPVLLDRLEALLDE